MVNGLLIIEENSRSFNNRAAEIFFDMAKVSIVAHDRFDVALCGGSTPRGFHQRLAEPPYHEKINWSKTHLFWVDDRCVPIHSPDSNYGNARNDFIEKVAIPGAHVHPMAGDLEPEAGALGYQNELMSALWLSETDLPAFDLVILGIGEDGHVASLFPGSDKISEGKWVAAVKGGTPNIYRLTLTYPVINNAKNILFLVSGKSKASIVNKICHRPELNLPAQKITPSHGKVIWVMDKDAAVFIKPQSIGQ